MGHYAYEIIGGILIFLSSLVSEAFPKRFRVALWVVFALLAIGYTVEGIHLDKEVVTKAEGERTRNENETRDLKTEIQGFKTNTTNLISTVAAIFPMIMSLNADLATLRRDTAAAKEHHDPRLINNLEQQAQAAQQRVDKLSHELLTITMAPQLARQLRDWTMESRARQRDLHAAAWEEGIMWPQKHPNDTDGYPAQRAKEWDAAFEKADEDSENQLRALIATADSMRKEMLQWIAPQMQNAEDKRQEKEFAQTRSDFQSLEKAANYLEDLARRVPPPPK